MAILEVCCDGLSAVRVASQMGAERVELCAALEVGGLTPSLATLKLIKAEKLPIAVIPILRPRAGGFSYCEDEFATCLLDAKELLEAGADGLAFGFLTDDFQIDKEKMKKIADLVLSYGKEAVCHRAFDNTKDMEQALQDLIECRMTRVLSSGQKKTAFEGIENLTLLQEKYGKYIQIMPGVSISSKNAKEILEKTKCKQIHASCKAFFEDKTTVYHVDYSVRQEPSPYALQTVSAEEIGALVDICKNFN